MPGQLWWYCVKPTTRVPSGTGVWDRFGVRRCPKVFFIPLKNRAWRPVFWRLQFNDLKRQKEKKTFVFIFFSFIFQ